MSGALLLIAAAVAVVAVGAWVFMRLFGSGPSEIDPNEGTTWEDPADE